MTEVELAWLAGLLEGEGSFLRGPPSAPNTPVAKVQMTDRDVIARVAALFEVGYVNESQHEEYKTAYQTMLRGERAVELMKRLRPFMGARRQGQIDEVLASYSPKRPNLDEATVREIRQRLANGEPVKRLSEHYKRARETIRAIRDGVIWQQVA